VTIPCVILGGGLSFMTCMPGSSRSQGYGPVRRSDSGLGGDIQRDVRALAETIGERNVTRPDALNAARDYIEASFARFGFTPKRETYSVAGVACSNVIAEIAGSSKRSEIVVVGAHYDSVVGSPGANDNASGTAALLSLARHFSTTRPARTLRFVAFVNEEPPWFQTDDMGSRVHAKASRARGDDIIAMLSLETLGCYSDAADSQRYPAPILNLVYPSRGNFVAFVSNLSSRSLLRDVIREFRESDTVPSAGGALPEFVSGVGWSDHESFWREGYPAVMVTDTAVYRDANYHEKSDTADAVDFARLACVAIALEQVVEHLVSQSN